MRCAACDDLLDVDVRAEIAALRLDRTVSIAGRPGPATSIGRSWQASMLAVDELDPKSLSNSATPSSMLSSTVCITLRVRSASARAASAASLAAASDCLALLQLGDVAVDAEDGAVVERLVAHLDVVAAGRWPLEADAARRAQVIDQFPDLGFDVVDLVPKSPRPIWKRRTSLIMQPGNTTSAG